MKLIPVNLERPKIRIGLQYQLETAKLAIRATAFRSWTGDIYFKRSFRIDGDEPAIMLKDVRTLHLITTLR